MIKTRRVTGTRVVEQRLLLHNVRWDDYEAIGHALRDRPAMRLNYDRGNLEIYTTASPSAPVAWTSDTQRLVLDFIDWDQYDEMLHALEEHHLRTTYDRGSFELMTLSSEHEAYVGALNLLIGVLAEEFNVPVKSLGSTTCRHKELERGLEPDRCFYITNWPKVRGKKRLDLTIDAPPDLVIDVDVTRSSLDRLQVYARLGVAEVWRFDLRTLQIYRLTEAREFAIASRSAFFTDVPLRKAGRLLRASINADDTTVRLAFRDWVRQQREQPASGKPKPKKRRKD